MFQVLIGRLVTYIKKIEYAGRMQFQVLIGRLVTRRIKHNNKSYISFKSLR